MCFFCRLNIAALRKEPIGIIYSFANIRPHVEQGEIIMKLDRKNIEKILFLGTALILIYLGLQNMNIVVQFFVWVLGVLTPFLIAVCCTFFLNVPLKAIEKSLFRPKNGKQIHPFFDRIRRPVAIVMSITLFLLIIGAFLIIIIPEIVKSINDIAHAIPDALKTLNENVQQFARDNEYAANIAKFINPDYGTETIVDGQTVINEEIIDAAALSSYFTGMLTDNAGGLVSYTVNMVSSVVSIALNIFLGLVLSIYTLMKKEKIAANVKKLIYAALPVKGADFIIEVGHLTNKSFYNSITGQMMECVILGGLTALGMTIFGFPYAALVGVMVAVLCWIPMFGVWIGAGIGTLFVLTKDPVQAIWFLVFMVCLQQIEGNFIFPRVVGSNMGLPPILMISAIVLFGNFFGFIGLIISCPVTSVVYTLTRRFVFTRLRKKKIPHSKFDIIIDKPKPRLHKAKKGGGMMGKLSGIFKSGKPVDFNKLKIKVKQKKH